MTFVRVNLYEIILHVVGWPKDHCLTTDSCPMHTFMKKYSDHSPLITDSLILNVINLHTSSDLRFLTSPDFYLSAAIGPRV